MGRSETRGRPAHLEQDGRVGQRQNSGEQDGQPPVGRGRVQGGHAQVPGEVEQVGDGRERAAEPGLAHLTAIGHGEAGDEAHVEAHQGRAAVQGGRAVGQQQRDHGRQVRGVGERHARPVPEPVLGQRRRGAANGREQVDETAWTTPTP